MCGIGGVMDLRRRPIADLHRSLECVNDLLRHRGPDGRGVWRHAQNLVGLAHTRLSIIDLGGGGQPMHDGAGNWIAFNGEIYNYVELRRELGPEKFRTDSDTEVILQAYRKWGRNCVDHLRGMFAFALWDESQQALFCARDRFGIKPFYYAVVDDRFYFASEIKALLPFLPAVRADRRGLADYLTFQFCLNGKTLFEGVRELPAAHCLTTDGEQVRERRYWNVEYRPDHNLDEATAVERLTALLEESVEIHLRSDVPVGSYLSGGLDSSLIAAMAARRSRDSIHAFNGKFVEGPEFDESYYARAVTEHSGMTFHEIPISVDEFTENLRKIAYHLDQPTAGPGVFPQYMVSRYAARHRKVVLGGQGGDEIFGGYARYLIGYLDQSLRSAFEGVTNDPRLSIPPADLYASLVTLKSYLPLMRTFFAEGAFGDLERRYFRLVNRAPELTDEIDWPALGDYEPFDDYRSIFSAENVASASHFDSMTHFDLKTLLPALLHVEDRVSMAHGLESRVPFLDHPVVEFAATIPENIKVRSGRLKHVLHATAQRYLPSAVLDRRDKMGFPVPLTQWLAGPAREFVVDALSCRAAREREFVDNRLVVERLGKEGRYSRKVWGLLSLELWQQELVDRGAEFRAWMRDRSSSSSISHISTCDAA